MHHTRSNVASFLKKQYPAHRSHLLYGLLFVVVSVFLYNTLVYAATYTFSQSSWAGGVDTVTVPSHPSNVTNWTKYNSQTGLTAGATVSLPTVSRSFTDDGATSTSPSTATYGGGFATGTHSNTKVLGSGAAASVGLTGGVVLKDTRTDYAVGASPQSVVFDSSTNSMWTANANDNTVTKRNASTGALLGTYTVGTNPQFIAFDPSTNSIWTANGAGTVTKLNASTGGLIGTYTVGTNPRGIAFDPSTNSVWVANGGSANLTKLNASTGSVVGTYTVATNPVQIAFDSSTNSMWVTAASNSVYKLNASTGATTGTYTVSTPRGVAFDSSTNSIWVTDTSGNNVIKLNASTGATIGTYATKGLTPYAIAFDSVTNSIWVANSASDNISKMKASTGAVVALYVVGASPWGVAFDSFTNSIWTSNVNGASVTKLSIGATVNSYSVGSSPLGVTFDSLTNSIWVANSVSSNVTKLNSSTGAVIGTYAAGASPWGAVFDSSTNSVWVANNSGGTITKFNSSTGAVVGTYDAGISPTGIAFDPFTNSVWVGHGATNNSITKINASSGATSGTYILASPPRAVAFDPSTNSIWAPLTALNAIVKINPSTGAVVSTTTVGNSPRDVVFDSSTNSVWVTNYGTGSVTKVTASTGVVAGSYSVGSNLVGISFDPVTNSIWVAGQSASNLSKLNAATGALVSAYTAGTITFAGPYGITFDTATNSIWVSNNSSSDVTKINVSGVVYSSSGTFSSAVIDLGGAVTATTLSYNKTTPANTSVTVDVRAGNTATPDGSWTAWTSGIASGGSISALSANRYFQYRANLSTTDTSVSPSLNDVTINYSQYASSGSLTSSAYDTSDTNNLITRVSWSETGTTTTSTVKFQVRSSSDGTTWSAWCGYADCSGTSYFTDSNGNGADMANNHPLRSGSDDRYIQYRAYLSSDGSGTPALNSISIKYVINAPPDFDTSFGTNGVTASQVSDPSDPAGGKVAIRYSVRDVDTTTGTVTRGLISPSFEYSINNGVSWVLIPPGDLRPADVEGKAVDQSVHTLYNALWNASATFPNSYGAAVKVRVTANDNEAANNIATAISAPFSLDTAPPAVAATIDASTGEALATITLSASDVSQLQYRLCNDPAFPATDAEGNSCAYSSFVSVIPSTAVQWIPKKDSAGNSVVYLEVRDASGNVATRTLVAPMMPTNFDLKDVSNPSIGVYKEFLSWRIFAATSSSAFGSYKVYNSTDGIAYTLLTTITNPAQNYFVHTTGNSTTTTEYYKMLAVSAEGNTSPYTAVSSDIPNGQGGTDNTPPTIDPATIVIPPQNLKNTSALITFTTDELARGTAEYQAVGESSWAIVPSASYSFAHSIYLLGLTPNTTYHTRVSATDVSANTSEFVSGPDFNTTGGPVITDVSETNISDTAVTIVWNTSLASDSTVVYSRNQDLSGSLTVGGSVATCVGALCQHKVTLSSLTSGVTYFFYVLSNDGEGNISTDTNSGTYYTFHTTVDTTPPVITQISEPVVSMTAAVIVWQTDEPATSQVNWGTAPGVLTRTTVLDTGSSINHIVTLSSATNDTSGSGQALLASTPYYFTVTSIDAAGNSSTSAGQTFTSAAVGEVLIVTHFIVSPDGTAVPVTNPAVDTTAPVMSSVTVDNIGAFSAQVHVATDEGAIAFVHYGPSVDYGSTEGDNNFTNTKTIALKKLTEGTTYHYRVDVMDKSGNISSSADQTFKTTFASEELANLSLLDQATDLQNRLEQLIESSLPSLAPPFLTIPVVSAVTENSATISWVTNIKAYGSLRYATAAEYALSSEYKVDVSSGAVQESAHSVDLANLEPNTTYHIQANSYVFPQVVGHTPDMTFTTKAAAINASIVNRANDGFTVAWQTDVPATSVVEYRNATNGAINRVTDTHQVTFHSVKIENLPSGTTFSVTASGETAGGNALSSPITLSVTTTADTTPPIISNLKVDNALIPGRADLLQTVVGWQTDKPANSTVYYEEGAGPSSGVTKTLTNKVADLEAYSTAHIMILATLKPGTVYRIQVVSTDKSGNTRSFGPTTIITPKQTQSVLDIIIKNFESTFKFLGAGG